MRKTRKMKDNGDRVVTRSELRKLLADWARAADVAMTAKVAQMKAEIREEVINELLATPLKLSVPSAQPITAPARDEGVPESGTLEHSDPERVAGAPTDSEGPEA